MEFERKEGRWKGEALRKGSRQASEEEMRPQAAEMDRPLIGGMTFAVLQ